MHVSTGLESVCVHKPTLGSLDSDLLEALSLLHRPDNSLDQLFNLLVQTTHICVLFRGLLVDLHGLDSAVIFGGQSVKDQVRVLVDTDEVSRLELLVVHKADEGEEDGLSGGCLDNGGFADAGGVEIDVGAFFGGIFFDIKVKDFNNVADKVW